MPDANIQRMYPDGLISFQDHSLLVTDSTGFIQDRIEGFYYHQTRFLSKMRLLVCGEAPIFVSANSVDSFSQIAYYLAPSPAGGLAGPHRDANDDGGEIAEKAIEIQLIRQVENGLHQDVRVTNHALAGTEVAIAWEFFADFADLLEAMSGQRLQTAPVEELWDEERQLLRFDYRHLDFPQALEITFHGCKARREDGRMVWDVPLGPKEERLFCLRFSPHFLGQPHYPPSPCNHFFLKTPRALRREQWSREMARLSTPVAMVQEAWDRAVADLLALPLWDGDGDEQLVPAAGIPLYQALFGRDTLTTAWQSSLLSPRMLWGTLSRIASTLGTTYNDRFDEQPGRVIHQSQKSPLSLLELNPYRHYYGDYAGPGMFLISAAWCYITSGDQKIIRWIRDALLACLEWIDRDGDRDGDGFYEYDTRAGIWGTKNQGWKDSEQAILYPDGRCVENPIAVVEVQGYVYAAKQFLGLTFFAMGDRELGRRLMREAAALKKRFNERFWLPSEGCFALALDADKNPVETIASNVGHCFACGILDADKARCAAGRLFAPDMFSGWGVRTLSSRHPAYNPFSYHLGSIWPAENASLALGLKRYGLTPLLHDLAKGLFESTRLFEMHRLPEVIGGHSRDSRHPHPGVYPQANAPQAWSSSSVILMIQALLGIAPMAPFRILLLDPDLPEWLPEVTLHDLQVGEAFVSLRFWRTPDGKTHYRILKRKGPLLVVRHRFPLDLPRVIKSLLRI